MSFLRIAWRSLRIAWRSVQQRALASGLTAFSMALGVALVIAVLVMHGVIDSHFRRASQGYHLIVGARGGKLQLVLNTVYHLSQPIENRDWSLYQSFIDGEFAAYTKLVIPFCLGDSYLADGQSFRVIGTTPDLFEKLDYGRLPTGEPLKYRFQPGGRNFRQENFFEGVIGSVVAHASGLRVGDSFQPTHGIVEEEGQGEKHQEFKVVGILEPTGTPNDRALFVNMEGFYLLKGHAKTDAPAPEDFELPPDPPSLEITSEASTVESSEPPPPSGPQPLPEHQREITALLVLAKSDLFAEVLRNRINESDEAQAQAVSPVREIQQFLAQVVGPLQLILLILTVLIIVVAGIGIMVSIYNSMNDRYHDIAVMRALGAGRGTVMTVILLESILLAVGGGLAGILLGHGLLGIASPYVVQRTGVQLHPLQFHSLEWILLPALVVLASIVGLLPALAAYRTDVGKALTATP